MTNKSQFVDMWVIVKGGSPLQRFQVCEDFRSGCYLVYGEDEDYIYFDNFARNLPVGHCIYIKGLDIQFIVVENKLWIDPIKENKMIEDHKGLPVAGYLPQSDEKVAMVNVNKELEERCLRRIEWFEAENEKVRKDWLKNYSTALMSNPSIDMPQFKLPYDPEMLKDAKMQIKQAFMWVNRSIMQPTRIKLSEDE